MNEVGKYRDVFDEIQPFAGQVPGGYLVDFLGTLTDVKFRTIFHDDPGALQDRFVSTEVPNLPRDGEGWFEAVDWVESAREARGRYAMFTLGACYGAQAVGAARAVQLLNPMPFKLVAIEPVPENLQWTEQHLRDNGIDPDAHWLVPHAISENHDPVYFPIGSPGTGAQNCFSTNEAAARENYVQQLLQGDVKHSLRELVLHNRTGLTKDLVPGENLMAEIELVSAISLKDLLGPFDFVDYVESDIQQSEILVFPPAIDVLRRKVRRIHIGTHGKDVHWDLHRLFESRGWEIVFSFEPNTTFETDLGAFSTNDGVLTVRNRDL